MALRYKLRMFGVLIDGPANVFSDNRGVVKNASVPESMLMKKHNSIKIIMHIEKRQQLIFYELEKRMVIRILRTC